jgi:CBS domain-containing protein
MRRIVQDVMTRDVVVAVPATPFKELARLLQQHCVGAAPILDEIGRVAEELLTAVGTHGRGGDDRARGHGASRRARGARGAADTRPSGQAPAHNRLVGGEARPLGSETSTVMPRPGSTRAPSRRGDPGAQR